MLPTTTTPAAAKPAAGQGVFEVGKHVQISGPYKGLSGKVQLVDKKKRKATVLLDDYGTTVNVAIELLAPLEVSPQ
jgi:transcription antitermination factor NusG